MLYEVLAPTSRKLVGILFVKIERHLVQFIQLATTRVEPGKAFFKHPVPQGPVELWEFEYDSYKITVLEYWMNRHTKATNPMWAYCQDYVIRCKSISLKLAILLKHPWVSVGMKYLDSQMWCSQ